MAKTTTAAATAVMIPPLDKRIISISLVGDSDLISHAWSEKAKKQMRDDQMGKAKRGKQPKNPDQDYRESLYWLNKDGMRINVQDVDPNKHKMFGFPSIGFKAAAVRAAKNVGLAMTDTRTAFHVIHEFVPIKAQRIVMREDMVVLNGKTADIRYRAAFVNWTASVPVQYNAGFMTAEQIVNLFNIAGFGVGVGEWRPEKDGAFGMFHVEIG